MSCSALQPSSASSVGVGSSARLPRVVGSASGGGSSDGAGVVAQRFDEGLHHTVAVGFDMRGEIGHRGLTHRGFR